MFIFENQYGGAMLSWEFLTEFPVVFAIYHSHYNVSSVGLLFDKI